MNTTVKNVLSNVICPVSFPDLSFELLKPKDTEAIKGAAECLAECFAGVDVEGVHISEPVITACKLSVDDMFEYTYNYLSDVCKQNLCYIAKNIISGKVIGAIACENFNPEEKIPVFEDNLAPMNIVYNFVAELDEKFVQKIEFKTGNKVQSNEYVHMYFGGARLKDKKRFVVIKLVERLIIDAFSKGYKGIFCEATTPKSVKTVSEYCGFHQVYDINGVPILCDYSKHPVFKTIPQDISKECRVLYRPLGSENDI